MNLSEFPGFSIFHQIVFELLDFFIFALFFSYLHLELLDDPLSHCVQASAAVPWLLEARTDFPEKETISLQYIILLVTDKHKHLGITLAPEFQPLDSSSCDRRA